MIRKCVMHLRDNLFSPICVMVGFGFCSSSCLAVFYFVIRYSPVSMSCDSLFPDVILSYASIGLCVVLWYSH